MDIHRNVQDLTGEALKQAHRKGLEIQSKYGVNCLNYRYSEADKSVFCLCEAPDISAATAVHREAHGLAADEVFAIRHGE